MKQIVTVIRPHLAESLLTSLRRAPIEALSVMEVKGYGRQKSYVDEYQETEYSEAFVPKIEITLWVDARLEAKQFSLPLILSNLQDDLIVLIKMLFNQISSPIR